MFRHVMFYLHGHQTESECQSLESGEVVTCMFGAWPVLLPHPSCDRRMQLKLTLANKLTMPQLNFIKYKIHAQLLSL